MIDESCPRPSRKRNAPAMSRNLRKTQQLFIYLGAKKPAGKSPRNGSFQATERAHRTQMCVNNHYPLFIRVKWFSNESFGVNKNWR
jgi:hypothetical protein